MSFTITTPNVQSSLQSTKFDTYPCSKSLKQGSRTKLFNGWQQLEGSKKRRGCLSRVNAFPDWPLIAILVEHAEGQRDLITEKSIWHLSDQAIKNVYLFYIMFTCWGCMFFSATKVSIHPFLGI
ncbi:hypothetical protein CICLE_v10022880mg [Citrus x clementina]|uniref:Uncharacterized protein n=1 Tax=Citrus clementina TaxID=85681 RepID=V4TVC5_CITCL|nr:hypothetical protein CICLE_v10022880mg [Citrus x clementina]